MQHGASYLQEEAGSQLQTRVMAKKDPYRLIVTRVDHRSVGIFFCDV
jgi:hypothetical protein